MNQLERMTELKMQILEMKSEINEEHWPEFVEWLIEEVDYDIGECPDCDTRYREGFDEGRDEGFKDAKGQILDLVKEA